MSRSTPMEPYEQDNAAISDYRQQSREFLGKGRGYLTAGDWHQAAEKGWGAAAWMAKAAAEAQGWQYKRHDEFFTVLHSARQLSGDTRIRRLRDAANTLHGYYYTRKRFLNPNDISEGLDDMELLLDILQPLTEPVVGGGGVELSYSLLPLDTSTDTLAGESARPSPTEARQALYERFASRIEVGDYLSRKLVSYQGNKKTPGLRWLKYKEGFSAGLVKGLLEQTAAKSVLDPFSGAGTAVLTAGSMGIPGTGIEIMPIGNLAARAIAAAANGLELDKFARASNAIVDAVSQGGYDDRFLFPHVPITKHAFPEATERDLAKAREFIAGVGDPSLSIVLTLACVSVLEEVSYTRKDGQFLRWDPQSVRNVSRKLHKAFVPTLGESLRRRLTEVAADIPALKYRYGGAATEFIDGSSLTELRHLPTETFDAVITSPPYANRYDYTRTYALELAYLGYDEGQFKELRQSLLSATVENRSKRETLAGEYGASDRFAKAVAMTDCQEALQEALSILKANAEHLSNRNIISLVENYFTEMALIVSELGRLVTPAGSVFMVNDNVRYHGEEIPVDLILSDFAEWSGFRCEAIWTLKQGKGNSSQQMGRYGRQEIRKCVYHWRKSDG